MSTEAPIPFSHPLPESLADRTVLILGGSSGVGKATGLMLRSLGARVVLVARDADRLAAAAADVRAAGDSTDAVVTAAADATDEKELQRVVDSIDKLDHVLVTAASVSFGSLFDDHGGRGDESLTTRFNAGWNAARVTVPRLPAGGSLTFLSGDMIDRPQPGGSVVSAGVGAIEALTRALAVELAPRRVRVNAIRLGSTDTPLIRGFLGEDADAAVTALGAALPLGRLGTAEEAASAAIFLMCNYNTTGSTLSVDGGQTLV
ncbi:SDR family oxidoreductase [Kribbella sp. CA-253562]|uniref:SDR family oxidoreductase n=1 Tax=Kribbella sp. CA-253562 TaxID=3239942 RepID=UPI003D8DFB42